MSDQLNLQQKNAVTHIDSPLLVLAGAGSGKTRVITQKIAYLIQDKVHLPEHITAVTFTNKAAREMKARVGQLLSDNDASQIRVSTFHTLGLNIIRKERKSIGLKPGFWCLDCFLTIVTTRPARSSFCLYFFLGFVFLFKADCVDGKTKSSF